MLNTCQELNLPCIIFPSNSITIDNFNDETSISIKLKPETEFNSIFSLKHIKNMHSPNGFVKLTNELSCIFMVRRITKANSSIDSQSESVTLNETILDYYRYYNQKSVYYFLYQQFINNIEIIHKIKSHNYPIINDPDVIEESIDKFLTYKKISNISFKEIKMLNTKLILDFNQLIEFYTKNKKRIILKPLFGSKGKGIIELNQQNFISTQPLIQDLFDSPCNMIAQQFFEASGDLRILVFFGKVVAIMDRIADNNSNNNLIKFNIHSGGRPAVFKGKEIEKMKLCEDAIKISELMKMDICGIDILHNESEYYFLETNSIPGLITIMDYYIGEKKSLFHDLIENVIKEKS